MGAREIIGLEAALGELGNLYTVARRFRALASGAGNELLPHVEAIGARLRSLLRQASLDAEGVDAAAAEIASLRDRWSGALDEVRAGPTYRAAREAWHSGAQERLADLLPALLAGVHRIDPPERLFLGVSLSSGRRRPGTSPFLTPSAAADKVETLRKDGVAADETGEWWDAELAHHDLCDDPDAVESPLVLSYAGERLELPVFSAAGELPLRVYARVLRAPFSVVLRTETEDEWWQAQEGSYGGFRDALAAELVSRGFAVEVV